MKKPSQLYDIFNENDIVTDSAVWGNKRFIVQAFHGQLKNLPELRCRSLTTISRSGNKMTLLMSPEYLELRDNPYRPLKKVDIKTVARMAAKGVREARREIMMRSNNRKLK